MARVEESQAERYKFSLHGPKRDCGSASHSITNNAALHNAGVEPVLHTLAPHNAAGCSAVEVVQRNAAEHNVVAVAKDDSSGNRYRNYPNTFRHSRHPRDRPRRHQQTPLRDQLQSRRTEHSPA